MKPFLLGSEQAIHLHGSLHKNVQKVHLLEKEYSRPASVGRAVNTKGLKRKWQFYGWAPAARLPPLT